MKTAFLFPGQGAQYIGMGKEFYDNSRSSRAMFEMASEVTGLDIAKLCFEKNEKLDQTEYTQIAMTTVMTAMLAAVGEAGIKADVHAGLSLGEYGALAASNVMAAEDIFRVVRERGKLMQQAVPEGGAMAAILGADMQQIESVCENTDGMVSVANYNCPGQIVITGEKQAVEKAGVQLKTIGAKRVVMLNVSGPFHSRLLEGAGEQLRQLLEPVTIHDFKIPYVSNVTAGYVTEPGSVKDLLARQISAPVKWQQSMELLLQDGADTFVEIGPGRTLSGFMKKINRDVNMYRIEKWEDIEKIQGEIK